MTTLAVRRSLSGPQAQCNSTDITVVVVKPPEPASAAFARHKRLSLGRRLGGMHRTSGPVGIELDNAEWEKKVMNSWPKKCTFVVREILQTERAYIASLEEIILGYMMPLHGYLLALGEGPTFIHTVFGNINKLRQLHEELLAKLHSACGDPHEFAEVFIETDFSHYREYCTQYTDANDFLGKSMTENEKLKLFITQCQHDLEHPLPLHSHLIKPVQRILKYQLMLQEMLKYISEEDVIYTDVKEALDKMRKVAEEIDTSLEKEKCAVLATPSTIARKRSKEIKSLQRSRRPALPEDSPTSELQRSLEFEDSFSLLRASRNSPRQSTAKTVGYGRRQPRMAGLTHLIGIFEQTKPPQAGLSSPLLVTSPPLPPPKPVSTHPPQPQSPPATSDQSPSLSPSHQPLHHQQLTSSNESSTSSKGRGGGLVQVSSSDQPSKTKISSRSRKTPLALRKSAPVVQRSRAEAQGVGGDRNSLCHDSAHALLVESQALLDKPDDIGSITVTTTVPIANSETATTPVVATSGSEIVKPETKEQPPLLTPRPHTPTSPEAHSKAKKPMIPPKQVLLPDKPLLGHTAHKRPRPANTNRQRRVVPPIKPLQKPLYDAEKFVIDTSSGEPVVSLPPALQQELSPPLSGSPPTNPPQATFFPSMLRPARTTEAAAAGGSGVVGVRSSVLARQEQMIEEMIRTGGSSHGHQISAKQSSPISHIAESHAVESEVGSEGAQGRKIPLLPPGKSSVSPTSPSTTHTSVKHPMSTTA